MVKTQEYNTPHPMTQEPIPSQYSFMNHGSNQSFRMMGITHRPETTYSAEPPPPPPQTPVRTLPAYSMASSATQSPIPPIIRVKLSPHMHFSPSFSSPGSDSTPQEEWSFSDVDPPREGEPTETEPGPSYTTPEDVKPFNQSYTESMSSCLHAMKQLNRARNKELFQLRESQAQFNETFNTWLTQIHEEVRQLKYNQMFHPRENQSNESSNTWLSQIHEEIRQLKYSQLDIGCHLMHKNTILNDLVHEIRNLNNNVMRVSEHLSTFAHITTSTLPDNTPIRSQHHSQTNQSGAPSNQS
ncbi:uncharacterized protein LOC128667206 [Bombina bombina]|uniref:uncharacterized protein LOC128667206 n=1 Tax=Bombina bombina TaxID=8345 RepID=UPI00235B246F|nr:uncharacterized protein LOC128667206 [Bombina bombina]